jgi:uroporphyrin-III C-methyltransferase/precorrin-2 dehydrogenase/sirohydrochlorin ferrochelatase
MKFLPVYLDIQNRPCLVIGGGAVATRKVRMLLNAGGKVTVVTPEYSSEIASMLKDGKIELAQRHFEDSDIKDQVLIIASTNNETVNLQIADLARENNIPCNLVDNPDKGSFIMPSVIDRSPVLVAVSTGGSSPVLARLIKARLESLIPAGYGKLAELAGEYRDKIKQMISDPEQRRRFWKHVLQSGFAERVFSGHLDEAKIVLEKEVAQFEKKDPVGEVYLVGAGPGDPDLLTFRALRLMQQADVVVYDRLVSQPILEMTCKDAERIYVGKERAKHAMRQEEINKCLAKLAKQGKRVLRLKGGDPFIFGRGGEEIDTLAEEGVPFQVVPGITAAAGCASYSGIPLTHRDYAQSVTFVTGNLKDGSVNLNWQQLSQPSQTVVFYMGLQGMPIIFNNLIENGVSPDMPAALIQQGTTPMQRVITGTLTTLPAIVEKEKPMPPTLIIVGEVVELQEKLSWYKSPQNPLSGATTPVEPGTELK